MNESTTTVSDQAFLVKDGEWQATCQGEVLKATFNSKGAALAGIEVEKRRKANRSRLGSPKACHVS